MRVEDHHVWPSLGDKTGDGTIDIDEGIVIHVYFIHTPVTLEFARRWVVAGQVRRAVATNPQSSRAVLVNTTGKNRRRAIDRSQIDQLILVRIETE